jgi:branched-chain amino acid transport system ATP-binding protein
VAAPLLSVKDATASYGVAQALFGASLEVADGEAVSLMGRNGMGKSTLIKVFMGMLPLTGGSVAIRGEVVSGRRPFHIARMGFGLVPEGRQIFSRLSVRENLVATACKSGPWSLDAVYALFPRLQDRHRNLGSQLSGGEQQMLAIGRALMTNPQLLILDEATEGLAPLVREEVWQTIRELRRRGQAILVVDKNVRVLAELCDRHVVLDRGRTVWQGDSQALHADMATVSAYLSV